MGTVVTFCHNKTPTLCRKSVSFFPLGWHFPASFWYVHSERGLSMVLRSNSLATFTLTNARGRVMSSRRKIRVSHSTGSERILTSDDESSTDTGIQNQSPSEGSADYSDSATEEEWTSVDYDDIGPSDSVSGPRAPSNRGPRQHPTSHGQRSSQVRRPRSVSYHRPIHRSVPVEVSPPRTTSYRGRDRIPPGPAEEEEEDIGPRYQTHRRPHRRPTSVNSDSLDPHDDYPGLARGAPHPHPHGQWADVPQHAAPPGYAGSMMSGAGPYQHQHYQAAGGMPGSANQLVRFAPHLDPYGYGAAGPNVYSPTPSNPFSPAASSSIGSSGYFEHGHHRAAAYPRAAPYPAGGNYYNNHPAGNPYPMYYYPQGDPHAESPPPGMKSYGRPASTPAVEDERLAKLEKLVIEQRDKEKAEAPKKEEDDKFTKLEKLILLQKEEQIAREKAAEARAKADKATVDAKLAKEVADKRAAEDTAKALTDAAAKARKDAEEKAADEAKKAKEEHEKKVKELTEAAEAAQKAADAAKAPGEKKLPIKFKDALGRKFSFPWEVCRTWKVCVFPATLSIHTDTRFAENCG